MEPKPALSHLIGILGLAGLPREQWTKEDVAAFDSARRFAGEQLQLAAQELGREDREGQRPQASSGHYGSAPTRIDRQEAQGGVREEGISLEARAQDLAESKT